MKGFLRVVLGTFVYIFILVVAAPHPSAAGLMLTFPALNGLGFLFAERSNVPAIAQSMLWMPVVNGLLCASYIILFLMFADTGTANWVPWVLLFLIAGLWGLIATRDWTRRGIKENRQIIYALAVTLLGVVLSIIWSVEAGGLVSAAATTREGDLLFAAWNAIQANWYKIALFAAAFSIFLFLLSRPNISDGTRGIFAGLPLVPFGGLLSIAVGGSQDLSERIATFRGMGVGVWVGPAVAVWFIFFISRYLGRHGRFKSAQADFFARLAVIGLGWALCGLAIAAITRSLNIFA